MSTKSHFCGILGSVVKPYQSDYIDWDRGREGYNDLPRRPVQQPAKPAPGLLSIRAEERLGSLIAAAGTVWAVYVATVDYSALWRMQIMPPGPVEVCALGILAWLHAKWRRSTKVD
jgi:hypothetical protein